MSENVKELMESILDLFDDGLFITPLMKEYTKETGKNAFYGKKITKPFMDWKNKKTSIKTPSATKGLKSPPSPKGKKKKPPKKKISAEEKEKLFAMTESEVAYKIYLYDIDIVYKRMAERIYLTTFANPLIEIYESINTIAHNPAFREASVPITNYYILTVIAQWKDKTEKELNDRYKELQQSAKYGYGADSVIKPAIYIETMVIAHIIFHKAGVIVPEVFPYTKEKSTYKYDLKEIPNDIIEKINNDLKVMIATQYLSVSIPYQHCFFSIFEKNKEYNFYDDNYKTLQNEWNESLKEYIKLSETDQFYSKIILNKLKILESLSTELFNQINPIIKSIVKSLDKESNILLLWETYRHYLEIKTTIPKLKKIIENPFRFYILLKVFKADEIKISNKYKVLKNIEEKVKKHKLTGTMETTIQNIDNKKKLIDNLKEKLDALNKKKDTLKKNFIDIYKEYIYSEFTYTFLKWRKSHPTLTDSQIIDENIIKPTDKDEKHYFLVYYVFKENGFWLDRKTIKAIAEKYTKDALMSLISIYEKQINTFVI